MEFFKGRKDLQRVEGWRLLMTKKQIKRAVQKVAREIDSKYIGKPIVLTGILKGAAWFLVDLSRALTIPYTTYFINVSSYHGQEQEKIKIHDEINPEKFKGRTVFLLDELFDSGETLGTVREAFEEKGIEDIVTCTLFVKNRPSEPGPDIYGVIVPNVWLVGCGLDDNQEKRGWPVLFACPKAEGIPKDKDDLIFESEEKYKDVLRYIDLLDY